MNILYLSISAVDAGGLLQTFVTNAPTQTTFYCPLTCTKCISHSVVPMPGRPLIRKETPKLRSLINASITVHQCRKLYWQSGVLLSLVTHNTISSLVFSHTSLLRQVRKVGRRKLHRYPAKAADCKKYRAPSLLRGREDSATK